MTTQHTMGICGGTEPLVENVSVQLGLNVFYTVAQKAHGSLGAWREAWAGIAADGESLTEQTSYKLAKCYQGKKLM